jgi:hypothetical protein
VATATMTETVKQVINRLGFDKNNAALIAAAETEMEGAPTSTGQRKVSEDKLEAVEGAIRAKAAELGDAAKVPESPASETGPQLGTIGDAQAQLKNLGVLGAKAVSFGMAFPELSPGKKVVAETEIPEGLLEGIQTSIDVMGAIKDQLDSDQAALEAWTPPQPEQLLQQGDNYTYLGVCGHTVEVAAWHVRKRRESEGDARITPFPRFCSDCLALRISLMGLLPFAATHETPCRVCGEPLFDTGQRGFTLSRSEIWENIVSHVTLIGDLLWRLVPQHKESHPAHKERREAFEQWKAAFELQVDGQVAKYPAMAEELRTGMKSTINEKRVELGLLET